MFIPPIQEPSATKSKLNWLFISENEKPVIYPDPADNYFYIDYQMAAEQTAEIKLFDLQGKCVYTKLFNSYGEPAFIEISELISGFYTYRIKNELTVFSGKLIVN